MIKRRMKRKKFDKNPQKNIKFKKVGFFVDML